MIIDGLQYNRDKIINRSLLEGTRFDDPEFIIEQDEAEFHEEPVAEFDEINTEVDITKVDAMEELELPPKKKVFVKKKLVARR